MITTAKQSSILQGFPKYRSMLAGNAAYIPSSYDSIATATGDSSTATITFNLSGVTGYKHLQIRCLSSNTADASTIYNMYVRFNGDTGNNYSRHMFYGYAGTPTASGAASSSYIDVWTSLNTYSYKYYSAQIIDILDFNSSTKNKTVKAFFGVDFNGLNSWSGHLGLSSGTWMNTNAITSITLTINTGAWLTGSTFALYGIKDS